MYVHRIRHNFPITADYNISRIGIDFYCLFHFSAPVTITIGEQAFRTQSNACILYKPGETRQVMSSQPAMMNWVHLNTNVGQLLERYDIPTSCVFYPSDTSFIPATFRAIEMEYFSGDTHKDTLINCYLEEFLIKLSRAIHCSEKAPEIDSEEQQKLSHVRQMVLSQPGKKWTVAEMAKQATLSPSRFHYVYKNYFGTTPIRDVVEAKMDYAKTLLLAEDFVSIQDVTDKLGYKSPYYFITQFKAVNGITPGAYQKNNR